MSGSLPLSTSLVTSGPAATRAVLPAQHAAIDDRLGHRVGQRDDVPGGDRERERRPVGLIDEVSDVAAAAATRIALGEEALDLVRAVVGDEGLRGVDAVDRDGDLGAVDAVSAIPAAARATFMSASAWLNCGVSVDCSARPSTISVPAIASVAAAPDSVRTILMTTPCRAGEVPGRRILSAPAPSPAAAAVAEKSRAAQPSSDRAKRRSVHALPGNWARFRQPKPSSDRAKRRSVDAPPGNRARLRKPQASAASAEIDRSGQTIFATRRWWAARESNPGPIA